MEIGRVCLKLAGRDAGQFAVVLSEPDGSFVLVDGNVRRKRCNIKHLEPTHTLLKLRENASTPDVLGAMESAGLKVNRKAEKKEKSKKAEPKTAKKPEGSKKAKK